MRETARNSGPDIDRWLEAVGQRPGAPWCVAFTFAMFDLAARELDVANPHLATAGSRRLWERTSTTLRRPLPAPGDVFVLDKGHGLGHVGIVVTVGPALDVTTVEGNTGSDGGRDGDGVFTHTWKPRDGKRGVLLGWLDFAAAIAPVGVASLPDPPFTA
jgi:hypothetical protein